MSPKNLDPTTVPSASTEDPPKSNYLMSLRGFIVDTATMSSVNVLRLLTQFLVVPVLARFLSPTDYGLVGLAMPFLFFAMIIADAGVGMSLVRTPADDRGVWSTCFWLSVLLGFALATLMATLAP